MSTETTKEDASVVDSSTSQKLDAGNLVEPDNSSYKANQDVEAEAEEEGCQGNLVDDSKLVLKDKVSRTKYFIIKSLNHQNIQLSVEKEIWATQVMNEPILEEAFNNTRKVILIFSVNSSGFFQGYAQMMSTVGGRRDNVWTQGTGPANPWGRSFKVRWLRLSNLPFHKTLHLKNPMNDYKPVKISRDCQELPPDIGAALCELIDKEYEEGLNQQRSGWSFPDEGYNLSFSDMSWAGTPNLHQSYLYHYHAGPQRSPALHHNSVGVIPPENFSFLPNKVGVNKHAHRKLSTLDSSVDAKTSSQEDSWQLSAEMNPLCSSISEDEFLEMSYEDYLEAQSRSSMHLGQPVVGKSRRNEGSSSKECESDPYSRSDQAHSRKRSRH